MNDRLYRSIDDRVLAGVAGGLADMWDIDPSLIRIAWVILTPLTAGFAVLVYIVMAIVVPEGTGGPRPSSWSYGAGYGPTTGGDPGTAAATEQASSPDMTAGSVAAGSVPAGPAAAAIPGAAASFGMAPAGPGAPGGTGPAPGSAAPGSPAPGSSAWSDGRRAEREQRHAQRNAERAARRAQRGDGPGSGAIIGGLILILIGAGVLASELVPSFDWNAAWPIGLIVVGGLLVLGSIRRGASRP